MTNQNDTQDEAERLAMECGNAKAIPVIRSMYPSKSRGEMAREFAQVFKEGYRAGVASRDEVMKQMREGVARYPSMVDEALAQRDASRAEVERLKKALYSTEESSAEQYQRAQIHKEQLAAEKARSKKLVEALEIYANRVCEFTDGGGGRVFYKNGSDNPPALPFYSGEQWELGHHAEKALADYSTDSGDGEKG